MKILIATEKPFASVAVTSMKEIVESAGFQLEVLENYKSENELLMQLNWLMALL